jgi:hypothetical protein
MSPIRIRYAATSRASRLGKMRMRIPAMRATTPFRVKSMFTSVPF